jgi:hypothetical protein
MKRIVLWVLSFPALVLSCVVVAIALAFRWVERPKWSRELGAFETVWRPKRAAKWRYSNAAGVLVIYHPDHLGIEEVQRHEAIHVRQSQDECAQAFVVGLAVLAWSWQAALVVWFAAPLIKLVNYATAWLRGLDAYRGAEHERSAYAQVEIGEDLR